MDTPCPLVDVPWLRARVDDPDTVIRWAVAELPDVIVPRDPTIDRKLLAAHVATTGEVPPGVTVTPPDVTVTIVTEAGQ